MLTAHPTYFVHKSLCRSSADLPPAIGLDCQGILYYAMTISLSLSLLLFLFELGFNIFITALSKKLIIKLILKKVKIT